MTLFTVSNNSDLRGFKIITRVFVFFFALIICSLIISIPYTGNSPDINRTIDNDYYLLPLSSAPLGYTIHIDNNWTLTNSTYAWCTGAGTQGDPWVIKDIEIDANLGNGILIGNSTDYFEIFNSNVYYANT